MCIKKISKIKDQISKIHIKYFNVKNYIVVLILITAIFMRLYRLNELMPFIGDFAWFYLSARDMILSGNIPLVGITSSHTWVHQGPLWTYLLAIPLFISNFNPLSGAYFTAALGTLTVFMVYKIGTQMFSKSVGVVAAALYATSPLVVIHARLPYHTSLIPLASLLFVFFIYKWVKGDIRFLPYVFFALGVLYNLELATIVFWILLMAVFFFGIIKRERWFTEALKPKIILLSVFLFLLAMFPMIIYDFIGHSSFYQTTAFFRLVKRYLFSGSFVLSLESMRNIFSSLFTYNERLVFLGSGFLALSLTVVSFVFLVFITFLKGDSGRAHSSLARMTKSTLLLLLWIAIPLSGIIVSRTASEAHMPMLFPAIIISIALTFNYMYKRHSTIAVLVILFVMITNSYLLIAKNYLMETSGGYGLSFSKRLSIAKEIVNKSKGREYNIIGKGKGSQYESFTMGYEYLAWWLGKQPIKSKTKLQFIIRETPKEVIINKSSYTLSFPRKRESRNQLDSRSSRE